MMVKKIRSAFLLFAGLTMIFSSVGGCAGGGRNVQIGDNGMPLEVHAPSPEYFDKIPAETPVRVHLASGNIAEGFYLSYKPEINSIVFRLEQLDAALGLEFQDGGQVYHIPLDKIVTLTVLESSKMSGTAAVVVVLGLIVVGVAAVYADALANSIGN